MDLKIVSIKNYSILSFYKRNNYPELLAWTNMKITRELAERERIDEIQFQRAGKGPLVKTYKYDPTKVPTPTIRSLTTVEAKKP